MTSTKRVSLIFVAFVALTVMLACSVGFDASEYQSAPNSNGSSGSIPPNTTIAQVTDVIDGDTIDVDIGGRGERVRLIGIDTPERGNCYYSEASATLDSLVSGQTVYLEADSSQDDRDVYNRILRYVWLGSGQNVNALMVERGYAFEYTYRTAYRYQATFMQAEDAARSGGIGLWSPQTCNGLTE